MLFHVWGYLIAIHILIRKHNKYITNEFSNLMHINLSWVTVFTLAIGLSYIFYFISIPILLHGPAASIHFNKLVITALAIIINIIGFKGLTQPEIFSGIRSVTGERNSPSKENQDPKLKYEKSLLSKAEIEAGLIVIQQVMEQKKLFKANDLTLKDLACETNINPHNCSQITNIGTGKNFYDFINYYRVEEIKKYLSDPEEIGRYTILSLDFNAGFNPKAAFNKIFKKITGLTPSKYVIQLRQKN